MGFSYSNAELAVNPGPESVPQPLARLLVRAQRLAELLLRLDQQLLVDDGGQDGARQQVSDVVGAAGEDPLVGDVLAGLLDVPPVRAEPGQAPGRGDVRVPAELHRRGAGGAPAKPG